MTKATHSGAIDSQWGNYQYLTDIANAAIKKFPGMRITSGQRNGDPHHHGQRQAIDIAFPPSDNGKAKYKEVADWVFETFPTQVAYVITLGQVRDRNGYSGTGKSGKWVRWPDGDHYDHLHISGNLGVNEIKKGEINMLPINKKISAYNHYDYNTIKYIVVHDVGTRSTAKNNVDYFFGGNRNASAHYFVDDTSIWQSVEDSNGAWHVGDGNSAYGISNTNSIGIEMCLPSGTVTAKTEANTLDLVKYLMKKYNVPASRVVRHYDASRKNCPAQFNLDGKWTRWFAFKAKLTSTATTPATATKSKFKVGDKVKVKALYANSTGGGKSTKSAGKIGVIKRDVGKGKRYLVENWGWAHENDIELVKDTPSNNFDINNYHTTKFAQIKLIKDDYAYKEVSLKNKVGGKVKKGTVLTVVAVEYNGNYPRFKLKSGLYITTRKDTVAKHK